MNTSVEKKRPRLGDQGNLILRFANDIVLLMDEDGNLLDANDIALHTYGWTLEELLKLNIRDLRDPSTLGDVEKHLALATQTGSLFETRHLRRDGAIFPVEVSSRFFEYWGRTYRQSIVRDISQRYRMQARIERDSKRFEGLLKLSEMATRLPEREFMQFGLEWVEKLTESKIAFIHFVNDDQETIELVAWSSATQEKYCAAAYDSHYPVSKAGIWADCLKQLKPVIFNDYESYLDKHGLPDGHSLLLRLISVPVIEDDKVRVILGVGNKANDYDADDIEIAQLFGNDMWRIIRRQRVEAKLIDNLEYLKTLNIQLQNAQNQLLQSEKMASLGQLAAGVAHELNNPIGFVNSNMNTLEGYLRNLIAVNITYEAAEKKMRGEIPAEIDVVRKLKKEMDWNFLVKDVFQLVSESKQGLSRVTRIVQDLKEFSHVGEKEWSWVDVHKGIDSTLNIVWNELKYKCEVIKEYTMLPEVYCIPSQINQVVLNLLMNAVQAIETKGIITIRTGVSKEEVWIEVADTGKGISPQDMKRIFEPFFTTKPVGTGTGLGLSLSYSIMQKHHGRIEVQSEINKGTTMRICLPTSAM